VEGTISYSGTSPGTQLTATYRVGPGGSGGSATFQYFLLGFNGLQFRGNVAGSAWCGAREGQALPNPCLMTGAEGLRDLPNAPAPFWMLTPTP
jgi:hypothetical protein